MKEREILERLAKVRERAFADESDRPLVALTRGDYAAARSALSKVSADYFGHARWQSMRAYAVRAIASLHTRPKEGRAHAEAMGAWFEGGSIEGHALALHALLGGYDRLEAYPPWPTGSPTRDEHERLTRRNAILRDEVRADFQARLALSGGHAPTSAQLRDDDLDASLGFEGALAAGDLALAERFAKRMIAFAPSWMDSMNGRADPRAEGTLALARVHRRRGQSALVMKRVDECLQRGDANATTRLRALVLGASVAQELGLAAKAKTYLAALAKQAPKLGELEVDGLSLRSLEDALGEKGRARRAVREGERAHEAGEHDVAAKAYARALGRGARLDSEGRTIAARWLLSLACAVSSTPSEPTQRSTRRGVRATDTDPLLQAAEALLSKDPGFVTAREARAYALARLGRTAEAAEAYRSTGLARLIDPLGERAFEVWSTEPPERALSPHAVTAEERAEALLLRGVLAEALEVLADAPPLARSSPLRFLIAGTIWNATVLESPSARRKSAEEAWRWLAPLATKPPEGSPYAIELPVLAAEILAGAKRHAELVKLPISSHLRSYPVLTKRAFARLLPHLLDAHLALDEPKRVIEEVEALFDDSERERTNRTILDRLVLAERALGRPETSREGSAPDAESLARELTNRAWALEQRGEIDEAIEAYLRAAELDPSIAAIGLGNAGNLVHHRGRVVLARAFFDAALVLCSFFPFASRASVLAKVGRLLVDEDPASAIPLFAIAFDAAPSAELARHLADAYDGVGDTRRAQEARARASRIEPRLSFSVPTRSTAKATAKKSTKATAKKATAKKSTKATAKKATAKKATKATAKRVTAKRATAKTATTTTAKKSSKTLAKKSAKRATPKTPARKASAKKSAKQAPAKKTSA
jgi:tetratricopeptide (TPR) repeat protein